MKLLSIENAGLFSNIRFVLTDMDETLTYHGRLSAQTYDALERLQKSNFVVLIVTAAPAGWCDQMARMWPIDGVIAENGGLFIRRENSGNVVRSFWHREQEKDDIYQRLLSIARKVEIKAPKARLANDQPFRLASIAFSRPENLDDKNAIIDALHSEGVKTTVNNIWIVGWLGDYDKLSMTRRVFRAAYNLDIDAMGDQIVYSGDSANDAPMFKFFRHSVGVSTVEKYLSDIPVPPNWITHGPGGKGFVEIAEVLLNSKDHI
jgi:HAD superfamily hydrolase (TIGR01484 family)